LRFLPHLIYSISGSNIQPSHTMQHFITLPESEASRLIAFHCAYLEHPLDNGHTLRITRSVRFQSVTLEIVDEAHNDTLASLMVPACPANVKTLNSLVTHFARAFECVA